MLDDIASAYDRGIQAPGKEAHFLILLSFIVTFGFIRTSAHMIRAEVSWWPGNVETKGGTHIHHLVWGILTLMVAGFMAMAQLDSGSPLALLIGASVVIHLGVGPVATLLTSSRPFRS